MSCNIDLQKLIKIQEEESSLKSNFKNPIDKFTKIDDLLRQNIALQRDLNKILLALYIQERADGSTVF